MPKSLRGMPEVPFYAVSEYRTGRLWVLAYQQNKKGTYKVLVVEETGLDQGHYRNARKWNADFTDQPNWKVISAADCPVAVLDRFSAVQ